MYANRMHWVYFVLRKLVKFELLVNILATAWDGAVCNPKKSIGGASLVWYAQFVNLNAKGAKKSISRRSNSGCFKG